MPPHRGCPVLPLRRPLHQRAQRPGHRPPRPPRRSLGSIWTPAEREAYANDLGDERDLIAVSAASNRSKADQDPSTWLPPAAGYRSTYVTDWIADRTRWSLTIDTPEQTALTEVLEQCPDTPITVTLAR
ncbi:putative secreted protein [Streptomyces sparsogenes DSM 40356]|uniref:Putative secreted protein n=1 Tax=Streptomyces sparsogenes DSM 40356 TaxID=1331668 RepID=A0A1R1SA27_9ACTN|nr:HNH endonuclease family protein [Streptomyces sparsogenes]OMI35062.1 putative secreted protein [Streptomyces sparsogenes DSM 40356]